MGITWTYVIDMLTYVFATAMLIQTLVDPTIVQQTLLDCALVPGETLAPPTTTTTAPPTDSTTLPPESRTSEETVKPESETLFY